MKRSLIVLLLTLCCLQSYPQTKNRELETAKTKRVSLSFLKWYKQNKDHLSPSPILKGFNADSVKKDSVVTLDMDAVDAYLSKFRETGYVSETFLNDLKGIYSRVADDLKAHPLKDYFGPVPGLEADPLFGFDVDEILSNADKTTFSNVYVVYHKGLLQIKVSRFTSLVFTLTKMKNDWLIDSITFNAGSKQSIANQ